MSDVKGVNEKLREFDLVASVRNKRGYNEVGSLVERILYEAHNLPTGLPDEQVIQKLLAERQEWVEAETEAEKIEEAVDQAYYLVKALNLLCHENRLDLSTLLKAVVAKYRLRARPGNPKDKDEERMAMMFIASGGELAYIEEGGEL